MQNNTPRDLPPAERKFRSRSSGNPPSQGASGSAVRQGRTDVTVRRQRETLPSAAEREPAPQNPPGQRQSGNDRNPQEYRREAPAGFTRDNPRREPASDGRRAGQSERPRQTADMQPRRREEQVVVGRPKSGREQPKPQPVIVDSPDIDSKDKPEKDAGRAEAKDERKFYFQKWSEISTLRRMLMLVFGLLFVWCIAPAFFHIMGIGVISSSAVMLGICLTAMFWHLIDRNWTIRKAAAVLSAAVVFSACVAAFSIVSGMMLKASLTVPPSDGSNYTVVVLGCKVQGDQPSWMLTDRLEKAFAVLSRNESLKCVVTGGKGDDEQYTEAYVMKKYLVEKGISPDRIYTEELSSSTEENLLYSKALIRLNGLSENIVIVTDRFHELRARMWAEKSGFRHIYSGCCETRPYLVLGYWFREMFGLARLYVFGI